MRRSARASIVAAHAILAWSMAGCGGTATFVSATPPPDAAADAWFASSVPTVHDALRRALTLEGFAVDLTESSLAHIAATKDQLPYVGAGAEGPPPGALPLYEVELSLDRPGSETHVRATLRARCSACDGTLLYEWQGPSEALRRVFERARDVLRDRRARFAYSPTFHPPAWHPPRRR